METVKRQLKMKELRRERREEEKLIWISQWWQRASSDDDDDDNNDDDNDDLFIYLFNYSCMFKMYQQKYST